LLEGCYTTTCRAWN